MIKEHGHKIKISLKKVRGQINLIEKMIDDERYCIDTAQQINAAIGILKQANSTILEDHLLSCGAQKLNSKDIDEKTAFSKELVKIFNLTNR